MRNQLGWSARSHCRRVSTVGGGDSRRCSQAARRSPPASYRRRVAERDSKGTQSRSLRRLTGRRIRGLSPPPTLPFLNHSNFRPPVHGHLSKPHVDNPRIVPPRPPRSARILPAPLVTHRCPGIRDDPPHGRSLRHPAGRRAIVPRAPSREETYLGELCVPAWENAGVRPR
jgi:hypothetical protein